MTRQEVAIGGSRGVWASVTLASMAGVAALALWMRLADPLSDPIIAAEDPYTHIVITKELVDQGFVAGSTALNYPLYPPGLHLLTAAFWEVSGGDLYDVARFLPAALGTLGAVGIGVLTYKDLGLPGGLAAGILAATIPEHIFRSNLLFPSTLDLFLIPAFLLCLAKLVDGDGRAAIPFSLVGSAILLAHPWAVMLLSPIAGGYVVLRLAFPPGARPRAFAPAALGAGLAAGLAWAAWQWWKDAEFIALEDEFGSKLGDALPLAAERLGVPPIALVALVAAGAVFVTLAGLAAPLLRRHPLVRGTFGTVTGVVLLVGAWLLTRRLGGDLPVDVNFEHMLGPPAILLAFAGLLIAPMRRSAGGDAALATVVVTFPLAAIDFFNSPYWPHRTVAYLSVGVALLGGVAVGAAVEALHRPLRQSARAANAVKATAGTLAVGLLLTQVLPVGAATYHWGRYYTPEEFTVIEAATHELAADPEAVVLVGTWQPNLFLRALGDEWRVVWAPQVFPGAEGQAGNASVVADLRNDGKTPYLLVDRYTREAFALPEGEAPWIPGVELVLVESCCQGQQGLYRLE